ncbi:MAG: hypothetical protein P8168_14800 [Deltaproteobacteria bacterium]
MKKLILLAVIVGLIVPAAAYAKAEFSLGGYVKLEMVWDSTQINRWLYYGVPRENTAGQHGRLKITAEQTRMNFTMKGPKVFGAQTSGFIEWGFDNASNQFPANGGWFGNSKARIGLRHAMFRLNWPDTELMMGQYWSVMTEEIPETANFGAATSSGQPFLRIAQVRLTQKFALGGGQTLASVAVCAAENDLWGLAITNSQWTVNANNQYDGESSETPMVQGRVKWSKNMWGKAAYWGRPRPFSVRVAASYHRTRYRSGGVFGGRQFGNQGYVATTYVQDGQEYLDHWLVEGSVFVPIIGTQTANLAGTASLLTQWFIGQGLEGFIEDLPNNSSYLTYSGFGGPGVPFGLAERQLMKRFGGFVQLQYYITNQWYVQAVYGINRAFDVDRNSWVGDDGASDPWRTNQQIYATVYYRPIQALKFGLEYTYMRTDYFQSIAQGPTNNYNYGDNHRAMFCGYFFF